MNFIPKLLTIPHLDLGTWYYPEELHAELHFEILNWYKMVPYESRYADGNEDFYREAWSGISLVGPSEDPRVGMHEDNEGPYQLTALGVECPNIMDAVYEIAGDSYRASPVRVMRIAAGRSLGWHSHTKDHRQQPSRVTVQIPIDMPEGFEYVVTTGPNVKSRIPPEVHDEGLVHRAHYEPGRAYVFNSFEYHNVFNPSSEDRYTIMFYVDVVENEHFRKIVAQAVENYGGPTL